MPFSYIPRSMTPQDVWDYLLSLADTPMSMGRMIRLAVGDNVHLFEHFEAITLADLMIPYTQTVVGGGTIGLYLDEEPSAILLATGAVLNDGATLESDRTFSLEALGGTRLIMEARLRISNEAAIMWNFGMANVTGNVDSALIEMDTGAAPPRPNGTIRNQVNGVSFYTDLALAATYDLTDYHTYRIELEPGVRTDIYVDDALVGSEVVAVENPDDQTFRATFACYARGAANRGIYVDYYRVWSE